MSLICEHQVCWIAAAIEKVLGVVRRGFAEGADILYVFVYSIAVAVEEV